jgi:hypothetical protein
MLQKPLRKAKEDPVCGNCFSANLLIPLNESDKKEKPILLGGKSIQKIHVVEEF